MPRNTSIFKEKWQIDCGVRILTRNTVTNEVESIVCMFCKTFGKEEPEDADKRKRKRSQNVQKFTAPWRTDLMKKHNKSIKDLRHHSLVLSPFYQMKPQLFFVTLLLLYLAF